jgi:hypothetical protein
LGNIEVFWNNPFSNLVRYDSLFWRWGGKIKKGIESTETEVRKLAKIEDRFSRLENEHNLVMEGRLKLKHK